MPFEDAERWLSDARDHGLPVIATGVVLFRVEFGLASPIVLVLLALLMIPLAAWGARQAFPLPEHGD